MRTYLIRRSLVVLGTALGIVTVIFLLLRLTPGDPVEIMVGDWAAGASQEVKDQLRQQLGLDLPVPVQYVRFLAQLFRGDLGHSFRYGVPVFDTIIASLPPTSGISLARGGQPKLRPRS